jgi:AAA15 family ATPase/GTPase
MLSNIKLRNFKVFKDETNFPLSKINLLTGINGRGKSSFLQNLFHFLFKK